MYSGTSIKLPRLGVNIDHIATLRQARRSYDPDPIASLEILHACNVAQVTCHLREDRRHIQDDDVKRIKNFGKLPINLEMAVSPEMLSIAKSLTPKMCTLVPEKREELTTEGGLDLTRCSDSLGLFIAALRLKGMTTSLFIDPDCHQVELARELGADAIELHTGTYCDVFGSLEEDDEWHRLQSAASHAAKLGLDVFAGHGLNTKNLPRVTQIKEISEYNIGHSLISRAIFIGLKAAIEEIQALLS